MDGQKLIPGRDYWLKLGTKLLSAIVTSIRHKVDINTGALLPADSVIKNEIVQCEIVLSEPAVLDEFKLHKPLGELILIDRVSYATAACGVIESAGEQKQDRILLRDGKKKLPIQLFDSFYYHPEIHTVLRHSPAPISYSLGETLPLQGAGFSYPPNFDLPADSEFAHIRGGIFSGFGEREPDYLLLDTKGIELETNPPRDFGKYHNVMIWEKDYEI